MHIYSEASSGWAPAWRCAYSRCARCLSICSLRARACVRACVCVCAHTCVCACVCTDTGTHFSLRVSSAGCCAFFNADACQGTLTIPSRFPNVLSQSDAPYVP